MVLSWAAGKLVNWLFGRLNAGDIRPILLMDAPDMEMAFPGASSWGKVYRGKEEHRQFLERIVAIKLQHNLSEVVAAGPPWRMTVCARGVDHLDAPGGERVYENRYVLWAHLRWGRIRRYEVYEDTEKTAALDTWLAQQPALTA